MNPEVVSENDRRWVALENNKPLSPQEMWQVERGEVSSLKRPAARAKTTDELVAEIADLTKVDERSEKEIADSPRQDDQALSETGDKKIA